MNFDNAAEALEGMTLKTGWVVNKKIEKKKGSTGGFFSICYEVSKDGQKAFLKALDFVAFFSMFRGKMNMVDIINEQTNAFKFEKALLNKCKNSRLTKVSTVLDEGQECLMDYMISDVPYLVFEMAEGDVRGHLNFQQSIETSWKLWSLHNVAVGLKQLHGIGISHQDLKPSNVLLYEESLVSKIGDLGRSLCKDIAAPHGDANFSGDISYSPPEFLYGYIDPDWNFRVRATDTYLFGGLIIFYFSGLNMTALIGKHLPDQFHWKKHGGDFNSVKDYLIDAFYKGLKEFEDHIEDMELKVALREVLEYCCFPDPLKRGHPKSIAESITRQGDRKPYANQFDFQRIVSRFDILAKKNAYKLN
jgi:serine/threonine protein kinase